MTSHRYSDVGPTIINKMELKCVVLMKGHQHKMHAAVARISTLAFRSTHCVLRSNSTNKYDNIDEV